MTTPKTLRPADCCAHCAFAEGTSSLMVVRCELHAIARPVTDTCGDFAEQSGEDDDE